MLITDHMNMADVAQLNLDLGEDQAHMCSACVLAKILYSLKTLLSLTSDEQHSTFVSTFGRWNRTSDSREILFAEL